MSSVNPGIDPGAQPQRWYVVEKIEHIKPQPDEEEKRGPPEKPPDMLLAGAFAAFLKRVFLFLMTTKPRGQTVIIGSVSDLSSYIGRFYENIQLLSREDQSFNPEFVQKLSFSWHALVEAVRMMDLLERKRKDEIRALQALIAEIGGYPPKEDHTLAFYFADFVGQGWLPFPFVELLSTLHTEYQDKKEESALAIWIARIGKVLESLNPT